MINKATFDQVIPLAQLLDEKGKKLAVLSGSPLGDVLNTCSTYGLHVEGQSFDSISLDQANDFLVAQCNQKTEDGYNEHNGAIATVVDVAGKAVSQALYFARNVVLADVKEVLTKVEQIVAGIRSVQAEPYTIHQQNTAVVFSNPLLHELVERFSNTSAQAVERRSLPPLDLSAVRAAIATGANLFDGEVEVSLSAFDDEGYKQVQAILEGRTALDSACPEYALGVHLLSKALIDNPYEGVNISLVEFNARMAQLVEQSGRMVYQEIERIVRRKKLGMLYNGGGVASPDGRVTIFVNNEVYLDMLNKGLTPEILIGNEFLGRRYNDNQLIENGVELTAIYEREMRLRALQATMEETNSAREALSRLIALEIANRSAEQLPIDRASLQARLNARIALIREKDLKCLPVLVRDLICHVFYAHTDALRILSAIDAIGEQYPEIDAREAALLATIQYVTYWISKQIVVA